MTRSKGVVVVHGGCGIIGAMTAERERECRAALISSANAAMLDLSVGRSALRAVVSAVKVLEDSPQFNAGKGSVFTREGTNEMDAGLMDGFSGAVGGVSTITTIRNPICAAECVLKNSMHSLICGPGAERFAVNNGCTTAPRDYFFTQHRYDQLKSVLKRDEVAQLDHNVPPKSATGTVGAVALDHDGHLASGSSTGGLTAKEAGRVSDSSIAGAGFYADREIAVSGTGSGDEFIRISAAKQIADLVRYSGKSLSEACDEVVFVELKQAMAGFIGVDRKGNVAMPFNTPGMFRVLLREGNTPLVDIFK